MTAAPVPLGPAPPPDDGPGPAATDDLATFCALHPGDAACRAGLYGHELDRRADIGFLVLFTVALVAHAVACGATVTGHRRDRRGAGAFALVMGLGLVCEIVGYAGRAWGASDPLAGAPFFLQLCCLAVGAAFMAAALYMCVRQLVRCFEEVPPLVPGRWLTRVFMSCYIVSVALQAPGGVLAAIAYKRGTPTKTGGYIMIAGLALQAFTMLIFILCSLHFASRVRTRYRREGRRELPETPGCVALRRSPWRGVFWGALVFSTLCLFVRCLYRVAERGRGLQGPLASSRVLFNLLESMMVLLASFAMIVLYTAWTFRPPNDEEQDGEVVEGGNPHRPFDTGRLRQLCRSCRTGLREAWLRRRPGRSGDSNASGDHFVQEMAQVAEGEGQARMSGAMGGDGAADVQPPAGAVPHGRPEPPPEGIPSGPDTQDPDCCNRHTEGPL